MNTIAGNEMKTLLRSWFFRIFALLTIVGLSFFNLIVNLNNQIPWIYRALACSIPYVNLILLNLGQAIVAVFLASEFLKQDRKNDTIEVIYARSMTNSEYIFGKTLGILSVFLILNLIVLCIGIGFSFINGDTSKNVIFFFAYPLLISLPTLLYIMGLSFFLMVILKNQAITFIILLGYIALSIFKLNSKAYHLFDFVAYQVPMTYSPSGGFGNLQEIILHRSIYFLAGLGLIFFTIFKIQRLPQSTRFLKLPLVIALTLISLSGFLMFKYYDLKQTRQSFKLQLIELNNKYADFPKLNVTKSAITLDHNGSQIKVSVKLTAINLNPNPLDTLLFTLNPTLKIESIIIRGKPSNFSRQKQLLFISYPSALKHGDSINIELSYSGTINEDVCFIDGAKEHIEDNFNLELFNIRKRYAFLDKNFVCLTSEALWYPIAGVGYATKKPFYYFPDFTHFSLSVQTAPSLTAVSQGEPIKTGPGHFYFKPETALPTISLLIGEYQQKQIKVDSVTYRLYTLKGDQYYQPFFTAVGDTMEYLIRNLKTDLENKINRAYPFSRFSLVEVPLHFSLDKHQWALNSDVVQPEMVLYPEKGIFFHSSDFKKEKTQVEKDRKDNNVEGSVKQLQAYLFNQVIRDNLISNITNWNSLNRTTDYNTYCLLPEFTNYNIQLKSENWPLLNLGIQNYFVKKIITEHFTPPNFTWGLYNEEKTSLDLQKNSFDNLVKKGTSNNNELDLKNSVFNVSSYFFRIIYSKYGQLKFDNWLNNFMTKNSHTSCAFASLQEDFKRQFGDSIDDFLKMTFKTNVLPGYIVNDIETYKVPNGDFTKFQVRLKLSNNTSTNGVVSFAYELTSSNHPKNNDWWEDHFLNPDYIKNIYIKAHSTYDCGFAFNSEPTRMVLNTYFSKNIPNIIEYPLSGFKVIKKTPVIDTIVKYSEYSSFSDPNEIIVDNEDKGFSVTQNGKQAYLKSLIRKDTSNYKYEGASWWNPPFNWVSIRESEFYGSYIHSAVYTRSGNDDRKAIWKTKLKDKCYYDISFYLKRVDWDNQKQKTDYTFYVYHDGGIEKVTVNVQELQNGWNSLGLFYISSDNTKVILSNKTSAKFIVADAIKWTKRK